MQSTSVFPDVHDGICSTPAGKYSTPSEALDKHDVCCRLGGKCSPPVFFLMYIMAYAVHLLANTVHQVRLLMHMMAVVDFEGMQYTQVCFLMYMMTYAVHLMANTVYQVRLLMHMMAVVDKMGNAVHPSVPPCVHDGNCSTPTGKYSTPSEALD